MNKKIFTPVSYLTGALNTPEEVTLYMYYGLTFSEDDDVIPFNYGLIGYHLFGRKPTSTEIKKIKSATQGLVDKGIITQFESITNQLIQFHFNYYKFNENEYFFETTKDEFFNICRVAGGVKNSCPFIIVDTYLTIMSHMDGRSDLDSQFRYKVCTTYKEALIGFCHSSQFGFDSAVKVLESAGCIGVVSLVNKNSNFSFNIYSRGKDLFILRKYAEAKVKQDDYLYIGNKEACNSKRRMTSIYNWVLKGSNYPFYVLEMVRKFILEYAEENPDQDRYNLLEFDSYMEQAATDILIELYDVPKQTAKKFSEEIPADYDEAEAAKSYLARIGKPWDK